MSAAKKKTLDTDQVASELSESAFFTPQPTSIQVDKTTKPQVDKYTTHLKPETIKAVKRYAFEHDMKDYEVVQRAIEDYLKSHK